MRLEGFPRLPRLKVLLLNNNRIAKIARNLEGRCLCVCRQAGQGNESVCVSAASLFSHTNATGRPPLQRYMSTAASEHSSCVPSWCRLASTHAAAIAAAAACRAAAIQNLETLVLTNNKIADVKVSAAAAVAAAVNAAAVWGLLSSTGPTLKCTQQLHRLHHPLHCAPCLVSAYSTPHTPRPCDFATSL